MPTAAGHFAGGDHCSGRKDFTPEWLGLDPLPSGTPFAHPVTLLDVTGPAACLTLTASEITAFPGTGLSLQQPQPAA